MVSTIEKLSRDSKQKTETSRIKGTVDKISNNRRLQNDIYSNPISAMRSINKNEFHSSDEMRT